jgi:hypothetical protein
VDITISVRAVQDNNARVEFVSCRA